MYELGQFICIMYLKNAIESKNSFLVRIQNLRQKNDTRSIMQIFEKQADKTCIIS